MGRLPLILCLPLILLASPLRAAQPQPQANRVLKTIDFEERRLGNDEDLPMNWLKVVGDGLPHYVNGCLATDQAHGGQYSFRFDLNGGSLIYRYDPTQIPIRRGARYNIEVWVKTTVLPHARARLTARFTDLDGHAIPGSDHQSELYAARVDGEDWHLLQIQMTADAPDCAFLELELGLLQPSVYATTTLGDHALFPQDIRGSAWFDDLTVSQVPQVVLGSDHPGNIYRRGDPLRIWAEVNDLSTDDLAARLVITDATGTTVYQRTGALDLSTAQQVGPTTRRLIVNLPSLPPGWYCASLVMTSHGFSVGDQTINLALLADNNEPAPPDPRFGMIAEDLPFSGWMDLPGILPTLGAGRVKLSIWSEAGDVRELDATAFDTLLDKLQSSGIAPTACLTGLPPSMAQQFGAAGWVDLPNVDPSLWKPQLSYLISRYSTRLDRWQLGADGSDVFVRDPRMRKVYGAVYSQFAALVGSPDLAMPWPAWYDVGGDLPATVALWLPSDVLPRQIPLYTQEVTHPAAGKEGTTHNLSLDLQLLDDKYGRLLRIGDLAQRVVYALSAGVERIDLPLPMTVQQEGDKSSTQPQELYIIERTLITTLGGAVFKGKVPIAEGVEAFLFAKDGQGILVLWNRSAETNDKPLSLNLGQGASRMDLWGNITPLLPSKDDAVTLTVGPMPFFLLNVDPISAQLRASVCFDNPLLESSFTPHLRHLRFVNPSDTTISGTVRLVSPPGWTLTPTSFPFSLDAGQTFDRPLTIEFPYNSFAGPRVIEAEFALQQGSRNTNFRVPLTLSLGLSDVGVQSLAIRDGKDLLVQVLVANYGDSPINYTAFAVYPGQPRQERLVADLAPGHSTIKLFRFKDLKFIAGGKVRDGVRELEGLRVLNDEIPVQ